MKIQLVSDLHLEFADLKLPVQAPVLVLAGDIVLASKLNPTSPLCQRFYNFLQYCSRNWQHVVVVAGNHEYYGGCWWDTHKILEQWYSQWPNVYYLERGTKVIDGVVYQGAALWTSMDNPLAQWVAQHSTNDYKAIRDSLQDYRPLHPQQTVLRHQQTRHWLRDAVAQAEGPVVVVTHHSPSYRGVHDRYRGDPLNPAFHNNLDDWIAEQPNIRLWLHGHVHDSTDYWINSTRVVANPKGYYNENPEFNPGLTLEL